MHIDAVELRQLELPMLEPLASAHGSTTSRRTILVRVIGDVGLGWGECVAMPDPTYTADWSDGEFAVLQDFLVPRVLQPRDVVAEDVLEVVGAVKRHNPAKAALEMAVLDAELRSENRSLASHLGATETSVESAVVIGLLEGDNLVRSIQRHLDDGFRHIKLKIAPGRDLDRIDLAQREFPGLSIRVDANGSYRWDDPVHRKLLLELDGRGLALIEQPLPIDFTIAYQALCEATKTPIFLDESLTSLQRALTAVELKACDGLNVKPGLIAGYISAKRLHQECVRNGVGLAAGGMIESAVGRAGTLALAALPGFAGFPAEVAPDGRWFEKRLNVAPVELTQGRISVPAGPGLGVDLDMDAVNHFTRRMHVTRRG